MGIAIGELSEMPLAHSKIIPIEVVPDNCLGHPLRIFIEIQPGILREVPLDISQAVQLGIHEGILP